MDMTVDEIRKIIVTAIASDEQLVGLFVFKGGNALELVHKIGQRASLDMDYSIPADFDDPDEISNRLFRALRDRFDSVGLIVFDQKFGPRPTNRVPGAPWGGYTAEFKLISKELHRKLDGVLDDIRRQALENGPNQQRKFRIEISAFEYCEEKISVDFDDYTCFVYSIEMIAVEKLRAICQQSKGYSRRVHPTPRARDFYDIYAAVVDGNVDFSVSHIHELVGKIFARKEVALTLLDEIHGDREFHRGDWPSVVNAVRVKLRQFDYYFEFVLAEIEKLRHLWMV